MFKRLALLAAMALVPLAGFTQAPPWKVDVLFVGAHPDDDSVATATLARLADQGKKIAVLSATRGENGGNEAGPEQGAALGIIRETEQRAVLARLGIGRLFYLERIDSGFTTSVEVSEHNWNHDQTLERLVRYVRLLQPQVIVTMNPAPRGHGDHQLIARLASEAYRLSGDPTAFPKQLTAESLRPWKPVKLYYSLEYGADGLEPSVEVLSGTYASKEVEALKLYHSQGWERGNMPPQRDRESFILAADDAPGHDLFAGPEKPIAAVNIAGDRIELQPIGAVASFRGWARRWKFTHLLRQTPSEVVLGQGEMGVLRGTVLGSRAAHIRFEGKTLVVAAGKSFSLPVRAPNVTGSYPLAMQADLPTDACVLKVVPKMSLSGDWQTIAGVWEGGPKNCGGRFRMLRIKNHLHFDIEVKDEEILATLDENRGHWRTDSVEICLDPSGRSQNTLTTFKVGIVPFNRQGRCMAARDADACPGPIARTAPGMTVASHKIPGGYAIAADIPLALMPPLARKFGLNVLIYDVDRDGSGVRLAWSAWETVQGTPRLWGRVLESP